MGDGRHVGTSDGCVFFGGGALAPFARNCVAPARGFRLQTTSYTVRQSDSLTNSTYFYLCLVYLYLFFYCDRRWRTTVNAVTRGRRASALARRSARSEHMGTSTDAASEIVSPGFCARLP
jgi:hypothetical protein